MVVKFLYEKNEKWKEKKKKKTVQSDTQIH